MFTNSIRERLFAISLVALSTNSDLERTPATKWNFKFPHHLLNQQPEILCLTIFTRGGLTESRIGTNGDSFSVKHSQRYPGLVLVFRGKNAFQKIRYHVNLIPGPVFLDNSDIHGRYAF